MNGWMDGWTNGMDECCLTYTFHTMTNAICSKHRSKLVLRHAARVWTLHWPQTQREPVFGDGRRTKKLRSEQRTG